LLSLLLRRGDRVEKARLYKASNEGCFGVQIATNNIAEGVKSAAAAQAAGASWIDINCGCPIYGKPWLYGTAWLHLAKLLGCF
jgi:tRNA-dihydrouridine synthase